MTAEQKDKFQEACYDQNSIDELLEGLKAMSADKIDMNEWSITATEWREALASALKDLIEGLRAEIPDK
jgi:hypothetical protein